MSRQSDFDKKRIAEIEGIVQEMFKGIPKTKRIGFIGHLNDILLFLEAARRNAPEKTEG